MHNTLNRYKLGIAVIGVFTLVLLVSTLVLAGSAKQDTKTKKAATRIADDLNSYIGDKNKIPSSLADANIDNVPDSVRYTKLSNERYKFCLIYKSSSGGFSAGEAESRILFGAYDSSSYSSPEYESTGLYFESTHKKGQNCQTIKPYLNIGYEDTTTTTSTKPLTVQTAPNTTTTTPTTTTPTTTPVYTDPTTGCTYNAGGGSAENKRYYACIDSYQAPATH